MLCNRRLAPHCLRGIFEARDAGGAAAWPRSRPPRPPWRPAAAAPAEGGAAPTGKKVSVPLVVSVGFSEDGRKVVSERIYWDQASVLQQIGKLELNQKVGKLPIVGKRQANTLLDPESLIGTHCPAQ